MGALFPHEPFLQQALVAMGVGVLAADSRGCITFTNPVAERLTGWPREEALGRQLDRVLRLGAALEGPRTPGPVGKVPPVTQTEEATLVTRGGESFAVEYTVTPVSEEDGRSSGLVVLLRDVSEQRLLGLHLVRLHAHDGLTGLLNRHAFLDHLERALPGSGGDGKRLLLFLDIDQLKLVNDTCDHAAGDELVRWVAELLREVARERDVVARLGGDEFALLVERPTVDEGVRFAEQLLRRLQEYLFTWEDKSFSVTACVGVAPLSPEFTSAASLLSAADHACYMAKERGRSSLQLYERGDAEVARSRDEMDWVARINHTLQSGQVRLYAQPIRPLSPMTLRGLQFEVLLRVAERDGRVRTPGQLVQAAERYGLMPAVDRWVVQATLRALRELEGGGALHRVHLCSVNLSGLSLRDASVLDCIRDQLGETGIPPHKLCFEITETAAVQNLQQARWLIQELSSIGCNIALDDFGTGLASYSYLKELPVNYLKVAGGFVEGMPSSPLDRAMVESINQISHLMGVETIAENVGSREVYDQVRAMGLDHAQGYWIGLPRPLEETCRPLA